jgi:hypothetical protein
MLVTVRQRGSFLGHGNRERSPPSCSHMPDQEWTTLSHPLGAGQGRAGFSQPADHRQVLNTTFDSLSCGPSGPAPVLLAAVDYLLVQNSAFSNLSPGALWLDNVTDALLTSVTFNADSGGPAALQILPGTVAQIQDGVGALWLS